MNSISTAQRIFCPRKSALALTVVLISLSPLHAEEKDSVDRDYQAELPRVAATEPTDALATFQLADGFQLQLAAHEPHVVDPIAMAFDEDGRLFVVEMRGYSEQSDEHLGRVRLLTDTDGDGKFDKSSVYAEKLSWPTAVCCYDGGVFVAAAPDIWYFKDTNDDGEAEQKEKVFTGFGRGNVQGLVNTFTWGPDNRIHGATSSSGATLNRFNANDEPGISLRGRDFSFDPRTLELRVESGGGQHGMCFDDRGDKFVCSNSDHLQMVMFEDRYAARNPYWKTPTPRISIAADGPQADVFRISPIEPWRIVRTRLRNSGIVPGPVERGGKAGGYFTGATGVTICRGDALGPSLRGYAIVGDVGSNLVHRKRLESSGVQYIGRRVDEKSELIASTDNWFRPVQYANGPDGALYVADMYREVIEHPKSLPPVIKKHLDLTSGRDSGRIYRLVPEGFAHPQVPKLSGFSTHQLVATLDHSNAWHRETAARLIFQQQDRAAVKPLQALVSKGNLPVGRSAALDALAGLSRLSPEALLIALGDDDSQVRRRAIRLSERLAGTSPALRSKLYEMADDEEIQVRYQLAFTLGELSGPQRDAALAKLLSGNSDNPWIRLAVGTSLHEGSGAVLERLVADEKFSTSPAGLVTIGQIAAQIGRQQRSEDVAAIVSTLATLAEAKRERLTAAILTGLNAAQGSPLRQKIDAASGGQMEKLVTAAQQLALDEKASPAQRADAVAQLRLGNYDALQPTFKQLLAPEQPVDVQAAAINAVATFSKPEVAQLLVDCWPTFTPATRRRASDVLFSRTHWTEAVVDAIEKNRVPLADFQQEHFARINTRDDAALAQRVAELLAARGANSPRSEVVANYQAALQIKGDEKRGHAAFVKNCAACHKVGEIGHEIGPNLGAMRSRGAEAILVNVLDPNREVNPQFVNYVAITKDGRSFTGMIAAETAGSITLVRGEGAKDTLLRVDLEELQSSGKSLMPVGMEQQLDRQAMADLLAFLLSREP